MEKLFLFFAILLCGSFGKALAYDFSAENEDGVTIYYDFYNDSTELAVTYNAETSYSGNIVIPDAVKYKDQYYAVAKIGASAFARDSDLVSVILPNSVRYVDRVAFYNCVKLESITFGRDIKSFGQSAFYNCTSLKAVHISDLVGWCKVDFGFDFDNNPLVYAKHLYLNGTEVRDLVIPSSITEIPQYAFEGCYSLKSVTIHDKVKVIHQDAFESCVNLDSVALPNSSFSIGSAAFYRCSSLTSITIPANVQSIGDLAFAYSGLATVVCLGEKPARFTSERAFDDNIYKNATVYVPKGRLPWYKSDKSWKQFVNWKEGLPGGTNPCAKPTIAYTNGELTFHTETSGAQCHYTITDADVKSGTGEKVSLAVAYNISVYASMSGYDDSETAYATLCWIEESPREEGTVDRVEQVPANTFLIQSHGGRISVSGATDGQRLGVYDTAGMELGSATIHNGTATIDTLLQPGSIAIIRMGEKSVKLSVK